MKITLMISKTVKWEIRGAEGGFVLEPSELKETERKGETQQRWVKATTKTLHFGNLKCLAKHLGQQIWIGQEGLEYGMDDLYLVAHKNGQRLNQISAQLEAILTGKEETL